MNVALKRKIHKAVQIKKNVILVAECRGQKVVKTVLSASECYGDVSLIIIA